MTLMNNLPQPPPGLPHPSAIKFDEPLTLYYKHSHKDFSLDSFQTIAKITNLQHFWQVFNNLNFNLYLNQGSFFLCCGKSPLWVEDGGTYSFIVGTQTPIVTETDITPWSDLCLTLLSFLLNENKNKNKIEGVSITKKRKAFNCKFATQFSENQPELIESFLTQLPAYFGNSKFMKNNARKNQFKDGATNTTTTTTTATFVPYHMRCGGGSSNSKKKPPLNPKKNKH